MQAHTIAPAYDLAHEENDPIYLLSEIKALTKLAEHHYAESERYRAEAITLKRQFSEMYTKRLESAD